MRRPVFKFALAAVAIATLGATFTAPAHAQSTTYNGERVLTKVQQGDLAAIVRENGDKIIEEGTLGDISILAQTPDGLNYVMVGTACNLPDYGPGCLGIEYQVRYDADGGVSLESVNEANLTYSAGKVSLGYNEEGEQTLFVSHYVILDGGQKMANLSVILRNVLEIGPGVADLIWPL